MFNTNPFLTLGSAPSTRTEVVNCFTTSGNWTCPVGTICVTVIAVGAGGGGGGGAARATSGTTQASGGAGGGGGG